MDATIYGNYQDARIFPGQNPNTPSNDQSNPYKLRDRASTFFRALSSETGEKSDAPPPPLSCT